MTMKTIKKFLCFIIIFILLCITLSGCKKNKIDNVKVEDNVISRTDLTLSKAMELYISGTCIDIGSEDIYDANDLITQYNYDKSKFNDVECLIFNISDSHLKMYAFFVYESDESEWIRQTVIVSEDLLNETDVYSIGDNISKIKSVYSDLPVYKNNVVVNFGKQYVEMLNKSGLYSYGIDESGNIVSRAKINLKTFEHDIFDPLD